MTTRTKPIRIFETDHAPLRLLADLDDVSPAELFHLAIAEYLHHHRERLSTTFATAQRLLADGDVEGLTQLMQPAAKTHVDHLMEDLAQFTDPSPAP
jgi:uncharacterized protein (DUF934 family)